MRPVIESEVRCEVVNPLLEISEKEIQFKYTWEENVQPYVQKKEITLKNVSSLTLSFYLKTEMPFNLNGYEFTLQPNESAEVIIDFDPMYEDRRTSHTIEKALTVVYRSHPTREKVKINAFIAFPNLLFESQDINFGCFLNETSKRINVRVTNTSSIPASYEWVFSLPSEQSGEQSNSCNIHNWKTPNPRNRNLNVFISELIIKLIFLFYLVIRLTIFLLKI